MAIQSLTGRISSQSSRAYKSCEVFFTFLVELTVIFPPINQFKHTMKLTCPTTRMRLDQNWKLKLMSLVFFWLLTENLTGKSLKDEITIKILSLTRLNLCSQIINFLDNNRTKHLHIINGQSRYHQTKHTGVSSTRRDVSSFINEKYIINRSTVN